MEYDWLRGRGRGRATAWGVGLAAVLLATGAGAAEVRVVVTGLRSEAGALLVALCPRAAFLGPACPFTGRAPAGAPAVVIRDVPPGEYAAQAFHDENANDQIDRKGVLPVEGMAFSRDAPMRFGPPKFADAAVTVHEPGGTLTLTMRYF